MTLFEAFTVIKLVTHRTSLRHIKIEFLKAKTFIFKLKKLN